MKRYNEIVFKAEHGIAYQCEQTSEDELVINAVADMSLSKMFRLRRYETPEIPAGYRYAYGEWYDGYVIERIADGSLFTWVPVGYLEANGTSNGITFDEQFGRRNWNIYKDKFSDEDYYEPCVGELLMQSYSIKKYGGFYISAYLISENANTGKPQSLPRQVPWTDVGLEKAKMIAATMETGSEVKSHLVYGAEYDTMLEWFIETKSKSHEEVVLDSSTWGNYWKSSNPMYKPLETGSSDKYCVNNIYDVAGNVDEWTQEYKISVPDPEKYANKQDAEQKKRAYGVVRGGSFRVYGHSFPAAYRGECGVEERFNTTGFRIALFMR